MYPPTFLFGSLGNERIHLYHLLLKIFLIKLALLQITYILNTVDAGARLPLSDYRLTDNTGNQAYEMTQMKLH